MTQYLTNAVAVVALAAALLTVTDRSPGDLAAADVTAPAATDATGVIGGVATGPDAAVAGAAEDVVGTGTWYEKAACVTCVGVALAGTGATIMGLIAAAALLPDAYMACVFMCAIAYG